MKSLFIVLLFIVLLFIVACSSSAQITKDSVSSEKSSTDAYWSDRSVGWSFRGDYYDSAAVWALQDTSITGPFLTSLQSLRTKDSVGNCAFLQERNILDHDLNLISLTSK